MDKLDTLDFLENKKRELSIISKLIDSTLDKFDYGINSEGIDTIIFLNNSINNIVNDLDEYETQLKEWCQMIIPDAKTKQIYNMIVNSTSKHPIATRKLSDVTGLNERTIRNRITELIFIYKVPIGAYRTGNNKGYFLIKNQDEYNQVRNTLKAQAFEELKRVNQLRENLKNWSDERWQHTHLI